MKAVLTDIEGTITSLSFVKDVLFPYAREALPAFVRAHAARPDVAALLEDAGPGLDVEGVVALLTRWIDEDRKTTPLKALQGMVWARGYAEGHFAGHIYADAEAAMRRWHRAGIPIWIYSSGSVEAQRLLMRHASCGDLTPLVAGYFDTRTGAKADVASYRAIVGVVGLPAGEITFFSDTAAELSAASAAGLVVVQLCREGLAPDGRWPSAATFDGL